VNAPEYPARAGQASTGRRIAHETTSNEDGPGRPIRLRRKLTQKVGLNRGEKVIRDQAFWEELSGQLPD
jgi:hypothetical protein